MKLLKLIVVTALAHTVAALPQDWDERQQYRPQRQQCITQDEAELWVQRYIGWLDGSGSDLGDSRTTGEALIADQFEQYSGSVKSYRGRFPVGNALLRDNKQDFLDAQQRMPQRNLLETLKVVAGCDNIVWFWRQSVGTGQYPSRGFGLFDMMRNPDGRQQGSDLQATRLDLEFDNISWLLHNGGEIETADGKEFPQGRNGYYGDEQEK